jgi:hypothetical protein
MMTKFGRIHWYRFFIGVFITGICALSVHAIMLQVLGAAFPDLSVVTPSYRFFIRAAQTLGLLVLWQYASKTVDRSFLKQWGLLFLITAMLTEDLVRGPFMAGYCTHAWLFAFVSNIPKLLSLAIVSAIVVAVTPRISGIVRKTVAAVILAAFAIFALNPLIGMAFAPVMQSIANLAPQSEWCTLPYGPNVLIPAYISFVEPTLACMAAGLLTWRQLSTSRGMRFVQFSLIVLAIKNQLLTPFFYAALAKGSFIAGLTSEGQFVLEALVLALLTGVTMEWSLRRASTDRSSAKRLA